MTDDTDHETDEAGFELSDIGEAGQEDAGFEDETPGVDGGETGSQTAGVVDSFRAGVTDALSVDRERQIGARIGRTIGQAIASFVLNLMLIPTRIAPSGWKLWRALCHAGYKGMMSASSADYIGHISVGGEIKHVPLEYDHESGKLETFADDWWHMNAEGNNTYRVAGRVPSVWASDRANEIGSHVQAEVAEVLDQGDDKNLMTDATVQSYQVFADPEALENPARADGGVSQPQPVGESHVSVADPGVLKDKLVPLDAGLDDDDTARVVSMDKYYQTYPSKVDPEEMLRQEERGRMAELDQDLDSYVIKVLLLALGFVAASLGGVWLLTSGAVSGGGGAVSGVLPGMIAPFLGLV
jgi:hypothetical protein